MNCEEFEVAWQEVEENKPLPTYLEMHRQTCPLCSQWVADLDHIRRQARRWLLLDQPSEQLWGQIRNQLQQDGVIKTPRMRTGWFSEIPLLAGFPRWSMGMAYAAVFLLAFGVVSLHNFFTNVPSPPHPAPPAMVSAEVLNQANSTLSGDQAFHQLMEKIPAENRPIYETSLQQVNNSIYQLNQFLAAHPEDLFTREQLFTVYEQKHRLWETLVQWEEF
ncbi:MAG: hypothetical protein HY647_00220 [Acidobacteria bacterium]|nr:hypothetical protein [Acidobacteriota bacterium]